MESPPPPGLFPRKLTKVRLLSANAPSAISVKLDGIVNFMSEFFWNTYSSIHASAVPPSVQDNSVILLS